MTQTPATPFALVDIVAAVRRRWVLGLLAATLAAAAVLMLAFRAVPLYEANATLTINRERKPVEFQVDRDSGMIQDSLINTYRELLLARDVLNALLAGLQSGVSLQSKDQDALCPVQVEASRAKVS